MLLHEHYQMQTEEDKIYSNGESGFYEPFTDDIKQLFKALQREYGRCTSKVYIDTPEGIKPIGWVFEKKMQYTDCKDFYKSIVWITLHKEKPTKTIEYHYQYLQ